MGPVRNHEKNRTQREGNGEEPWEEPLKRETHEENPKRKQNQKEGISEELVRTPNPGSEEYRWAVYGWSEKTQWWLSDQDLSSQPSNPELKNLTLELLTVIFIIHDPFFVFPPFALCAAEHCGGGRWILRWLGFWWQHKGGRDQTGPDGDDRLREVFLLCRYGFLRNLPGELRRRWPHHNVLRRTQPPCGRGLRQEWQGERAGTSGTLELGLGYCWLIWALFKTLKKRCCCCIVCPHEGAPHSADPSRVIIFSYVNKI